jgi:HSP20 family protein
MSVSNRVSTVIPIVDRWDPFDNFFSEPFSLVPRLATELASTSSKSKAFSSILSTDLIESENDFQIHCDLPGVDKSDLDISINDGNIIIKAERKDAHEMNTNTVSYHAAYHYYRQANCVQVHRVERSFGKVQRTISLPRNADSAKAQANLDKGVLTITLPKVVASANRKIEIA